eukprot:TRINITY_DN3248_c0_g1_i15.p1 TRINITY_DN3248_c0_g1~~TRINITY_DN3248_c0_g1_i15.p1  ORF type:complete len:119 (-),score=18.37 TRINITY_DN3248_c0_g1_i15:2-358(-)
MFAEATAYVTASKISLEQKMQETYNSMSPTAQPKDTEGKESSPGQPIAVPQKPSTDASQSSNKNSPPANNTIQTAITAFASPSRNGRERLGQPVMILLKASLIRWIVIFFHKADPSSL